MSALGNSGLLLDQRQASASSPRRLESSHCFACSPENARGLKLDFQFNQDGAMVAEWVPEADLEGYQGIVHGGVVSTVLDEAMAKVVDGMEIDALTAELRVRFRRQIQSGSCVHVRGWMESRERRMLRTEALVAASDGHELAHAWATFLILR